MEIITREEALGAGLTQYFTGKPCRHGHIAYRYTRSGACSACIQTAARASEASKPSRADKDATPKADPAQLLADYRDRREAANMLAEIRIPAHLKDLPTINELSRNLCKMAYPVLQDADIQLAKRAARNMPLYKIMVPQEHIDVLRAAADELFNMVPPDLSSFKKAHKETLDAVNNGADLDDLLKRGSNK